jgi:hypothetical protein
MRPYFIVHFLDEEGERLLEGGQPPAWPPGWSRKVDKRSLAYLWDRALRQDIKEAASRAKTARRRSGKYVAAKW